MDDTAPAGFVTRNNQVIGSILSIIALLVAVLLGAGLMFGTDTRGVRAILTVITVAGGTFTLLLLAIMLLVVVVGTAMDMTPTILILTPVLVPVVKQAGIDPVYFGVLFIINNAIGLITPPVGTVLNVVCGVSKLRMEDLIRGVWPFMLAQLTVLFLLVLFPGLVTVPARWFAG